MKQKPDMTDSLKVKMKNALRRPENAGRFGVTRGLLGMSKSARCEEFTESSDDEGFIARQKRLQQAFGSE